ncbi:hypothetical protein DL96DRAFT_1817401 [Flagelloscypha sp. PMI_526]|nr:hypothetical protein DL96DRAFT_1817401 [Flagelloscypha sp. PMI_526]
MEDFQLFPHPRVALNSTRTSPCLAPSQVLATEMLPHSPTHKKGILGYVAPDWKGAMDTPDYLKLEPNSGGVWIPPLPLSYLQNPLSTWARAAQVEPIHALPNPDEKVVSPSMVMASRTALLIRQKRLPASLDPLQLHTQNITHSFSVEYRLASTKPFDVVHPFPTTIIDCLSDYHHLIHDVGFTEENIIVVGDSAGENLVFLNGGTSDLRHECPVLQATVPHLHVFHSLSSSSGNIPTPNFFSDISNTRMHIQNSKEQIL